MPQIVGHLDMDAFFAAIEERDNPQFRGLPIVVGADPRGGKGRGVVSTANYKAREYGIHSAQPISQAWRCSEEARRQGKPAAVFLPVNHERYAEISERIMEILRAHASVVEEASIDEAYFDLSRAGSLANATAICRKLKDEIKAKEQLTASIGIGPNRLIAKIASGVQKPDGLTVVGADDEKACAELVEAFLEPLSIRAIPGIGPKTEVFFREKGIERVRDLKKFSQEELREMLGKWGGVLYERVRGRDDSPLEVSWEPKSIGEQETFLEDTRDPTFIFKRLSLLCRGVFRSFQESGFKTFRTVTITARFHDFETKTRSHTLEAPAKTLRALQFETTRLLAPFLDKRENPHRKKIRLIGVRVEKLM